MSDRRRKYSENSVVASIGQIQAMLAAEEKPARPSRPPPSPASVAPENAPPPPAADEQAAPVAMPVRSGDLAVPSWEEVQSNRAARWSNESQDAVVVRAVSRWRLWRGRLVAGAVTLALVGATVAVMWAMRPAIGELRPMELPYTRAILTARLEAQAQTADANASRLEAQIETLGREKRALEAELAKAMSTASEPAALAEPVAAAAPPTAKAKKRTRRVKRRTSAARTRSKQPRVRRTRTKATGTDKNLEGLLNTL